MVYDLGIIKRQRFISTGTTFYDSTFTSNTLLISNQSTVANFVADASTNTALISILGDTRPYTFNPYNHGYYSNFFNGSTAYLTVPYSSQHNLGANNFTIEAWIFPLTTATSFSGIINNWQGGGEFGFQMLNTRYLKFSYTNVSSGASTISYIGTSQTVSLNTWNHVAVTRNGAILQFYVNGVSDSTSYSIGTSTIYYYNLETKDIRIGVGEDLTAGTFFNGYISNVRLVNGTAVYTGAFTPPTAPLTVTQNSGTNISAIITTTSLLTAQSSRFIDTSYATIVTSFTLTGTPQISQNTPFLIPGTITRTPNSYSIFFNGSTDCLTLPVNSISLAGNFTIECWVYLTFNSDNQTLFSIGQGAVNGLYIKYYSSSGGRWSILADGNPVISEVYGYIPANTWYHLAFVRSGTTVSIYRNGVFAASGTTSTTFSNPTYGPTIGAGNNAGTPVNFLNGYISNFRLINGSAIYPPTVAPPTAALTATTDTVLLTAQSDRIVDNSTLTNTLTLSGTPRATDLNPFGYTTGALTTNIGSAYFDGTGDYLTVPANSAYTYGTGDFTVECWAFLTTATSSAAIVGTWSGTNSSSGWLLSQGATNVSAIRFGLSDGTTATFVESPAGALILHTWMHIVASRASGTLKLFVNGVQQYTGANVINNSVVATLGIGAITVGTFLSTGYISNVRVVKGQALYTTTSSFVVPTLPFTATTTTQLLTLQTPVPANNDSVFDYSTFKNNVAATGTPAQGSFSPYGSNWSVYFNGSTDYLTSPASAANQMTADFTIECWIYPNSITTQQGIIGINATSSSSAAGFALYIVNPGKLTFFIAGNASASTTTNSVINLSTWQHIAFVHSGSTNTIYVNGVSVFTNSAAATWPSTPVITIGRIFGDSASYTFNGYISNLRIIKGTARYTSDFTVPTSPLNIAANTSLLACASNRFNDISGVSISTTATFTTAGTPSLSRFTPFANQGYNKGVIGGSTYFNGTTDYSTAPSNTILAFGTGDFTAESWIYPTTIATNQVIFDHRPNGSHGAYAAMLFESGFIRWYVSSAVQIQSTSALILNSWTHVAVCRISGTTRMYINGVLSGSPWTDSTIYLIGAAGMSIGASTWSASRAYFTGYISDLRIVKGTALYTANFNTALPNAPLRVVPNTTLLLNMTDAAITDASMMGNITTIGDARSVSTTIKKYNSSPMYFDGTGDYLRTQSNPALAFGTGDLTLECWIYQTETSVGQYRVIFADNVYGSTGGYTLYSYNNALNLWKGGSVEVIAPAGTITLNAWTHVAWSRSGSSNRLFINGTQVGATTSDSTNYIGTSSYICASVAAGFPFAGYVDDIRITKGVARYTANFTAPTPPKLR